MRAVAVDRFLDPSELVVGDLPDPVVGEGEVGVDVAFAGCNFFDTLIVQGKYQVKPAFPFAPGGEISGTVRELGPGASGFRVGDRVLAYVGHGGFAERVAVPAASVYPVPRGMPLEEAAALPIVYGTAYASVVQRGQAAPGETVVVTAAAGGVGLASVQIAKAIGARVVGLASGDKLSAVREAGADVALDYRTEGWVHALGEALGPRGADVVIENVGGDVWDGCTKHAGWGARLVVVGFTSGKIPEMKLNRVLLKHVSVVGVHFGPMRERQPHLVKEAFRALGELYRMGRIRPPVSRVLPLAQVKEALSLLGSRGTVGKVVLAI